MKYFYALLFLILPELTFAQSNYYAGYILKNGGDTVKGFINYREWERSPKKIDFKLNITDKEAVEYSPEVIKGFGINGQERYVSYIGIVTMGRTTFPDLPSGIDTTKQLDTLFLRQLATGKYLTLYSNKDNLKTRLFITEPGAEPSELIYYAYYTGESQIFNSLEFKRQLMSVINKTALYNIKLTNEINDLTYDPVYVERLVNHINGVKNKKIGVSRFFASIGLNTTTSEESFANYSFVVKRSTTLSPKISCGFDFFNNPKVQQFIFRIELSASYITPRFNYPVTISSGPANEVYEYNQYTVSFTPQVLFNLYNKDNFKFYIDAGWGFNLSSYSNDKFTVENEDAQTTNSLTVNKPFVLEPFWSNFPVQAGIVLNKKIELYATYVRSAAYTKYTAFYASNQYTNLGVKFIFGK